MKLTCSNCGKRLSAPEQMAGKRGKCPACGHVFVLPSIMGAPSADNTPSPARRVFEMNEREIRREIEVCLSEMVEREWALPQIDAVIAVVELVLAGREKEQLEEMTIDDLREEVYCALAIFIITDAALLVDPPTAQSEEFQFKIAPIIAQKAAWKLGHRLSEEGVIDIMSHSLLWVTRSRR